MNIHPTYIGPLDVLLLKAELLINLDKKPILKKRSISEVIL
jgi:hypothetical protein